MNNLHFDVDLQYSDAQLTKHILESLAKEVTGRLQKAARPIEVATRRILVEYIHNSPTYQAMLTGDLRSELGLENAEQDLAQITRIIQSSVHITHKHTSVSQNGINGGFFLYAIQSDYQDLLNSEAASYSYFSKKKNKDVEIHWLDWMLTHGDRIIVLEHELEVKPEFSRTDKYIMTKRGVGWKVPSQYSGIITDNFITKSIAQLEQPLEDLIISELNKVF